MKENGNEIKLQVLICAYGSEGIERVATSNHPATDGVEYLVSWQASAGIRIPEALKRDDFRIICTGSTGLSKNRNHALSKATAPILLISDDDVSYTTEGLASVIESFRMNPEADIITFKFDSQTNQKRYPAKSFSLKKPDKGYFVSSIEIAFRRDPIKGKIWFNEHFGIGAQFPSGEEDIFIKDCLNAGLKGIFIPKSVCSHDAATTSERNLMLPSRPYTKGAVFNHLHPRDWFIRMMAHALREIPLWKSGKVPSPAKYCLNWLRGSRQARKMDVFPTPDYSSIYMS